MVKLALGIVVGLLLPVLAGAADSVKVKGYFKTNGTYVAPHERSRPNAYKWDNTNYSPSQEPYNKSYYQPTKQYGSQWFQPNADRFADDNPYNDYAPVGKTKRRTRDSSTDAYMEALLEQQSQEQLRRERQRQEEESYQQVITPQKQKHFEPEYSVSPVRQQRGNSDAILVDPESGKFLGNVNSNPYDPDSISNPYGRFGSQYSPDSVNNPYGTYGSRFSDKSLSNPYADKFPLLLSPAQNSQFRVAPFGSGTDTLGQDDDSAELGNAGSGVDGVESSDAFGLDSDSDY